MLKPDVVGPDCSRFQFCVTARVPRALMSTNMLSGTLSIRARERTALLQISTEHCIVSFPVKLILGEHIYWIPIFIFYIFMVDNSNYFFKIATNLLK